MEDRNLANSATDFPGAVVVCGAGAAGLAAALSAALGGSRVLLLERSAALGGTVANALIHTLGGLYDSEGQIINGGLSAELIERLQQADPRTRKRKLGRAWVLNVCPHVYRDVVTKWIADQPEIAVLGGARLIRLALAVGRIVEVEIAAGSRRFIFRPRAVIDATGTAEATRLIDKSLVLDDGPRAAGGWIFRLGGLAAGALDFPKGLAIIRDLRAASAAKILPPLCSHAWLDTGIADDEAFVKLMVPLERNGQEQETSAAAHAAQTSLVEFLRRLPGFARAEVTQTGALGVRDGGRIRGRYTLTADDVRQGRTFADAACRCAWPIEYWDAERGVSVEYLPAGVHYEVPMAALQMDGVANFWAVGKCLSADRWAHASARVVGACWGMGQAAGTAAASCRSHLENQQYDQPLPAISPDCPAAAGPTGHPRPAPGGHAFVPRVE